MKNDEEEEGGGGGGWGGGEVIGAESFLAFIGAGSRLIFLLSRIAS